MTLQNKNILLGITGGIAAYKAASLTRLLVKAGASVRVVMTESAQSFITALTFQALSGHPVRSELFDPEHEAAMGHIELARWADLILIAPASANSIEKIANGRADDLLSTLCLAGRSRLAVVPAMNQQMWKQAATQNNIKTLKQNKALIFGPVEGEQACGDQGPGRMLEPEQILELTSACFKTGALAGKQVLITAGPTREPLDPVRFLTNRSSGKMGYSIAQAAVESGAIVTLISGPASLETPRSVERIDVETGLEMYQAVIDRAAQYDILIATAAVSDYRPETTAEQKTKKQGESIVMKLTQNPDIVASVAEMKDGPFTVGFAAETTNLKLHALAKLETKKLDMIAANLVGDNLGFDQDENALDIYWNSNHSRTEKKGHKQLEKMSKHQLARELVKLIAEQLAK